MKKILFFSPAILYYALIFYFSSRIYEAKIDIFFFDKGLHVVEFGLLGFFLSLGYFRSLNSSHRIKAFLTLSSGVILGTLDELHQYFVPGRSSEILDVIADAIGIFIGLLVYLYLSRKAKRK